jgi:hypothetical protein
MKSILQKSTILSMKKFIEKVIKQTKEKLFSKFSLILYGIAVVLSIIYGLVYGPFYVHFIDGITIMGMLYFMIAVVLWSQKGKIIDKRSIQLKRFKRNDWFESDSNNKENYTYYKEKNKFIYPSLLILLIAFILAELY